MPQTDYFEILQTLRDKDGVVNVDIAGVITEALRAHGDNGILSMVNQSGASAQRGTSQSINNATWTTIVYNAEFFDTQLEYNNTTGIFTCKEAGVYILLASCEIDAIADQKNVMMRVRLNSGSSISQSRNRTSGAADCSGWIFVIYDLSAGDTLHVDVQHNHGAARNLQAGTWNTIGIAKVA